ncbi:nucleic acid/nucleotide deaminase domain-containing protein [Streptomyces sp. NPDC048304]|uniref:nucleic acid/nucleotide deaminase domain-containing protein n=1 Tax=Streptomyces sp. NPDC048304 TaxID=3154820 RepID=UPI0033EBFEFD
MGYTIPGWLDQVLDYIGIHFPNVDEDDYRHMATAMREFADKFEGHGADAHKTVEQILASSKGWAVHSMQTHWNQVKAGHLDKIPELARLFADALDVVADVIFGMKTKAEAELAVMAGSVGLSIGAAFFTGGLSAVLGAAEITAMRQLVKRIIDEAVDQIVNELIAKVSEPVNAKLEAMIEDAVLNLAEDAFSLPPDPTTGGAGGGGAGGGGADGGHGHGHGGMKLASAGGGGGMELASASGGPGGGGDLHIDHEEFESGAGKLSFHGSELHLNSAAPLGRAKGLFGRTRGKDAFTHPFESMIHGALEGCEKALVKVGKHLTEVVPDRARGISRVHKGNDIEIGDRVKRIEAGRHRDGDTPMYLLNADGSVYQLHHNGDKTRVRGDEEGLPDVVGNDGKVWRYRQAVDGGTNPYPVKEPSAGGPKVQSRRLDPDETSDLAYATQLARYAKGDYSNGNYAAAHYVDSNGNKFILVGHSQGVHSERTIGYPVLKFGNKEGIQSLYTEREPCQDASSWCDQWLAQHFDEKLPVTHSHSYDQTRGPDGKRDPNMDAEHKEFIKNLRDWHSRHGLGAGMMTESDGAAMKAARGK